MFAHRPGSTGSTVKGTKKRDGNSPDQSDSGDSYPDDSNGGGGGGGDSLEGFPEIVLPNTNWLTMLRRIGVPADAVFSIAVIEGIDHADELIQLST